METTQSLSNGELLLICLAVFAAVLIFPRLLRRRRIQKQVWEKRQKGEAIRPEDFTGKQKLFHTHNGKASEIEQFLAALKSHASRHGMKIVFPGNFLCNNTVSPSSMILVGRFGLLVIRCYGFGGHIYTEQNLSLIHIARWTPLKARRAPCPQEALKVRSSGSES